MLQISNTIIIFLLIMDYTPAKRYTEEQKQQAIKLANEIGWPKAAKQLNINRSTIRKWVDPQWYKLKKKLALEDYYKNKDKLNKRNTKLKLYKKEIIPEFKEKQNKQERDRYNNDPITKEKQLQRCSEHRRETFTSVNPNKKIYTSEQRKEALELLDKIGIKKTSKQLGITVGALRRWSDPNYAKEWHAYAKKRYDANPKQHTEKCILRHKERLKTDPLYKIKEGLRHRQKYALRKIHIKPLTKRDEFGCTGEQLIQHIESQFEPWMNWENYGKWDIDHIKPYMAFGKDLTTREAQLAVSHYTNLRPLCSIKNRQLNGIYHNLIAQGLSWDEIVRHPAVKFA